MHACVLLAQLYCTDYDNIPTAAPAPKTTTPVATTTTPKPAPTTATRVYIAPPPKTLAPNACMAGCCQYFDGCDFCLCSATGGRSFCTNRRCATFQAPRCEGMCRAPPTARPPPTEATRAATTTKELPCTKESAGGTAGCPSPRCPGLDAGCTPAPAAYGWITTGADKRCCQTNHCEFVCAETTTVPATTPARATATAATAASTTAAAGATCQPRSSGEPGSLVHAGPLAACTAYAGTLNALLASCGEKRLTKPDKGFVCIPGSGQGGVYFLALKRRKKACAGVADALAAVLAGPAKGKAGAKLVCQPHTRWFGKGVVNRVAFGKVRTCAGDADALNALVAAHARGQASSCG